MATYEYDDRPRTSLKDSWHHCQQIFSASSFAAGWKSLTHAIEALPLWALILGAGLAAIVVFDSALLVVPVTAGLGLLAVYYTVKRAVQDGLRNHREGSH